VQRGTADEDGEGQAAGDRPGRDQDRHREREHHSDVRERAQRALRMPNASCAAFITAELSAGKKKLAPMPLMMLATPVRGVAWTFSDGLVTLGTDTRLGLTRGCQSLNERGLR
jgi:hypothetical protein